MHKYLNDLGIPSDNCCIFNSEQVDEDRDQTFTEERKKCGFDSRETWSLDFTSAGWIYSHLMMYREVGGAVVDLTYHEFNIPVLYDLTKEEIEDRKKEAGAVYPVAFQKEIIEKHSETECIDIILSYLKYYLCSDGHLLSNSDFDSLHEYEIRESECLRTAFKIYAEIVEALWW